LCEGRRCRAVAVPRTWKWLLGNERDDGSVIEVEACRALYYRTRELWGDRIKARIDFQDEWSFSWVTNCSWDRLQHAAWTLGQGLPQRFSVPSTGVDEEIWNELMAGMGEP
jgi:hypothetical protein